MAVVIKQIFLDTDLRSGCVKLREIAIDSGYDIIGKDGNIHIFMFINTKQNRIKLLANNIVIYCNELKFERKIDISARIPLVFRLINEQFGICLKMGEHAVDSIDNYLNIE